MIQQTDPDNLSIRIPIRGRAALIRNTLIGAVLGIAYITTTGMPGLAGYALGQMAIGSLLVGGFAMLTAWLGQLAARHAESRLNHAAIWYAGLIGGAVGVVGIAYMLVWSDSTSLSGDFAPVGAFIQLFVGLLAGGGLGAVLTSAIAIVMLLTPQGTSRAAAPHLLGEREFDPLHHMDEVHEQVRR
jgi:hypothetical protein